MKKTFVNFSLAAMSLLAAGCGVAGENEVAYVETQDYLAYNSYALDESLSQLIGNAQFNIAVFDIDNFRMINDMYGYEFGDEYLATIAERLKSEYSEYAEMFNITGNEFCMVFYEHVSDLQAQQLSEQIRQGIGQPTLVANIPVQTTVSSSLYHYLPSDNLDVNTLLMKMDSALHAAKRDGGNRMYQIQ